MINAHDLTQRIIGYKGIASAVRETTEALASCWDEAVSHLPPKMREAEAPNPYRAALAAAATEEPPAPRIEIVEDPVRRTREQRMFVVTVDDPELAAMQIIVATLDELDDRTQNRVIKYVSERVAYETQAQH